MNRDWLRDVGTVLIVLGVCLWVVYAGARYLLGWDVTDRQFLPYHLAAVIPGALLRYHRVVAGLIKRPHLHNDRVDAGSGNDSDKAKKLMIVNKFIHDLFGGIWVGAMVAVYLLNDKADSLQETPVVSELHDVMRVMFWLGISSIGIIFVTGAFWFVHYRSEYRGDLERAKRKILVAKHILLGIIFLAGTYLAYGYTFN